jgi:hypothetical protein
MVLTSLFVAFDTDSLQESRLSHIMLPMEEDSTKHLSGMGTDAQMVDYR